MKCLSIDAVNCRVRLLEYEYEYQHSEQDSFAVPLAAKQASRSIVDHGHRISRGVGIEMQASTAQLSWFLQGCRRPSPPLVDGSMDMLTCCWYNNRPISFVRLRAGQGIRARSFRALIASGAMSEVALVSARTALKRTAYKDPLAPLTVCHSQMRPQ